MASGAVEWAALLVTGCRDAPVSWGAQRHAAVVRGDNDAALVFAPGDACVAYAAVGECDTFTG